MSIPQSGHVCRYRSEKFVIAEVERLVQIGATKEGEYEEGRDCWIVMEDPEGNEFCVH